MIARVPAATNTIRTAAFASAIGTTIEWYDFFLYGVVTPLVFNKLFFPNYDAFIGTLLAYTTFFVGFISRPIGGIIFGHFGDRIGRRTVLVLKSLVIMGLATFLIGLLPTYGQVGVLAPILAPGLAGLPGDRYRGRVGRRGIDGDRAFSRRQARASTGAGRRSGCPPACC